jgi:hypothetical protein
MEATSQGATGQRTARSHDRHGMELPDGSSGARTPPAHSPPSTRLLI